MEKYIVVINNNGKVSGSSKKFTPYDDFDEAMQAASDAAKQSLDSAVYSLSKLITLEPAKVIIEDVETADAQITDNQKIV